MVTEQPYSPLYLSIIQEVRVNLVCNQDQFPLWKERDNNNTVTASYTEPLGK